MSGTRLLTLWIVLVAFPLSEVLKAQGTKAPNAVVSKDYAKYNLKAGNKPEVWEDGMRTEGEKGTFEWWYFDSHLEDSTNVVIIFYTKPFVDIRKGLTPYITLEIDRPDGTSIKRQYYGDLDEFSASKTECNIQMGKNYFRGNLEQYEIHVEDEDLNITVKAERTTESWRPETGHLEFSPTDHYFAWMVPVPQGKAEVNYTYQGQAVSLKGSCYHDHNWGNKNLALLFNHWYWSRAEIGPYTVIASEMVPDKKFETNSVVVFNVSRDGKTLADNAADVTLYRSHGVMHPELDKDVSEDLVFIYDSEEDDYRYEYYLHRDTNLLEVELLAMVIRNKFMRKMVSALSGFDGAYFRINGEAEIRVYKNDEFVERHTSPKAVWELMYFGKPLD